MIPILCTCGAEIGHKKRLFDTLVSKHRQDKMTYYSGEGVPTLSYEGELMNKLKVRKQCCRRHLMTAV